jgi:hypothetical protein
MGRAGNNEFRIQKAAQELLDSGIEPSVRKIQKLIGGGNELITKHLRSWRERQKTVENSDGKADYIENAISYVYDKIEDKISEKYEELLNKQDLVLAESKDHLIDAGNVINDYKDQLGDRNEALAVEIGKVESLTFEVNKLKQEFAVKLSQIDHLETRIGDKDTIIVLRNGELADAMNAIRGNEVQITDLKTNLGAEKAERKILDTNSVTREKELKAKHSIIESLESVGKILTQTNAELTCKITSYEVRLDTAIAENIKSYGEIKSLQESLIEKNHQLNDFKITQVKLENEIETINSSISGNNQFEQLLAITKELDKKITHDKKEIPSRS